jgi:undecaprenyl pyrophosphate phosphatase UppP
MNYSLIVIGIALIIGSVFYDELYNKEVENLNKRYYIGIGVILAFIVAYILIYIWYRFIRHGVFIK